MKTMEEALAAIHRRGWAIAALGMLRENAFGGKPKKCYCVLYPAFFGREIWWDVDKDSAWSRVLPNYTGHGVGHMAAIESALKNAEDAQCLNMYARLSEAFERVIHATSEATDRARGDSGE